MKVVCAFVATSIFLAAFQSESRAGFTLTGEVENFIAAGQYSLDVYGTFTPGPGPIGTNSVLEGFNITLNLNPAGFSFVSATLNPTFETPFVNNANGMIQIGGTSTVNPGLNLDPSQPLLNRRLVTLTFNANAPGPIGLTSQGTFVHPVNFDEAPSTVISAPALTSAVPEPSSLILLWLAGAGFAVRQFRGRSLTCRAGVGSMPWT